MTKAEPSKREEEGDGVSSVPRDPAGAPLRVVNNNPEFTQYAASSGRLIVDFAVENRGELMKQAKRRAQQASRAKASSQQARSRARAVGRGEGDAAEAAREAPKIKLTRAQRRQRAKGIKAAAAVMEAAGKPAATVAAAAAASAARKGKKRPRNAPRATTESRMERGLEAGFGDDLVRSQPERREKVKKTKGKRKKPSRDEESFESMVRLHKKSLNVAAKQKGSARWFD